MTRTKYRSPSQRKESGHLTIDFPPFSLRVTRGHRLLQPHDQFCTEHYFSGFFMNSKSSAIFLHTDISPPVGFSQINFYNQLFSVCSV